jgi:hypothetical protein
MRNGAMATALLSLAIGCERYEKKLDAKRIEMRDAATACPPPTTCTEKHRGDGGHDLNVCTAAQGEATYTEGDIVLVHEIGLNMIARVKGRKGSGYAVEFADGNTLERSASSIVKRVCK